jgi:hypothetical protein
MSRAKHPMPKPHTVQMRLDMRNFTNVHFPLLYHEYLSIDTYDRLLLVHKQLNSVSEVPR